MYPHFTNTETEAGRSPHSRPSTKCELKFWDPSDFRASNLSTLSVLLSLGTRIQQGAKGLVNHRVNGTCALTLLFTQDLGKKDFDVYVFCVREGQTQVLVSLFCTWEMRWNTFTLKNSGLWYRVHISHNFWGKMKHQR